MCQFSYQPLSILSSKTCILAFPATKLHSSFSFLLFPTITSHILVSKPLYYPFAHRFYPFFHFILVSKPLYYSFAHRFYSFFHFIRRPFAILSLTCISFPFISLLVIIHMPQTSTLTHSPSFHVLIRFYLSLLSLSLHTTIQLKLFFVTRHIIHRSLLLFLSDI